MQSTDKTNEIRLAKLYETIEAIDSIEKRKVVMPSGMDVKGIKEYIQNMIKDAQPRHLRKEGRKSHSLDSFKIPTNYFVVESNSVNFNSTGGSIFLNGPEEQQEEQQEEEEIVILNAGKEDKKKRRITKSERGGNKPVTTFTSHVPGHFRTNDYGTMIALHIFKYGRKTIDEMVSEIKGIEKHLMTILVNKMIADGYLKVCKDEEQDKETGQTKTLDTLELVDKQDEESKRMLSENQG